MSDEEWRLQYKRAVIESVEAAKPAYLSVGNEVNRWYEKYGYEEDNGFKHWVSLYEEIYNEVKTLSPETKVFCTFSREIVSENREADMNVLGARVRARRKTRHPSPNQLPPQSRGSKQTQRHTKHILHRGRGYDARKTDRIHGDSVAIHDPVRWRTSPSRLHNETRRRPNGWT